MASDVKPPRYFVHKQLLIREDVPKGTLPGPPVFVWSEGKGWTKYNDVYHLVLDGEEIAENAAEDFLISSARIFGEDLLKNSIAELNQNVFVNGHAK